MPTWFVWSPVAPVVERYIDDGSRDLGTAAISVKGVGDFELGIIGTKHRVELIRIATRNSDGNLSAKQAEMVSKLVDHALAVLKIAYDVSVDLVRWGDSVISLGAHDVDGKPSLNVQIDTIAGPPTEVAAGNICNLFGATLKNRPLIKLIADSQTPSLPLQYRYLSLYKILELEFRVAGRWIGLRELLEPHSDEFKALKLCARPLLNAIHEMRDKCAHIKVGGRDDLGILGLDSPDAQIVDGLVKFLRRILIDYLSKKFPSVTFVHVPADPTHHATK